MENPRPRRSPESHDRPEGETEATRRGGARSSRGGLWPLLLGGLLAGVLLVALLGSELRAMVHRYLARHDRPPPAIPIRDERARLAVLFQEAKNHIRESRWTEARALLLQMQAEAPDYPSLKDYLERVEQELPNQEHLKAAQAALTEQRLAAAKAELDQVTPDTTMFEQVNSLQRALRDAADKQVEEAKALYAAGQRDPAMARVQEVLTAFPAHAGARRLEEEMYVRVHVYEPPPPPPPPPSPPSSLYIRETAIGRFIVNDVSGAVALAKSCAGKDRRCTSLVKKMEEFRTLSKKLDTLDAKGVSRLLALDKDITGAQGPGKLVQKEGPRLAEALYQGARKAKAQGQWTPALEYSRLALQAVPGHAGATGLIAELRRTEAQRLYDRHFLGYRPRDSNPEDLIPLFREIMSLTAPEDELHQKAKASLEKLSPD